MPTLEYCSGIYTKGRALKRPQILLSFYLKASILFNIYKCMICHWQTSKKIDRKRTHFVIFLNICMIANLKEFDGLKFWEFTLIYRIVWNDLKFQNNEFFFNIFRLVCLFINSTDKIRHQRFKWSITSDKMSKH